MATSKGKKSKLRKPKAEPESVKVYFVTEEIRAFLLEYLQLSPAGQYAPATVNNAVAALRDAGFGHVKLGGDA